MAHAKLSPSSAHRWMECPGSVVMEEGLKDETTVFMAEGTAAHFLAEQCLINDVDAKEYQGRRLVVWRHPESESEGCDFNEDYQERLVEGLDLLQLFTFPVDLEMSANVQTYLDDVRSRAASMPGELHAEQKLSIEHLTGEEGAEGTTDTLIVGETILEVVDLKYGKGKRVFAEGNQQTRIYALAALEKYGLLCDFEAVTMVINQPRLDHVSEETLTVEELLAFGEEVKAAAEKVWGANAERVELPRYLVPGDSQCQWCKAKAKCRALAFEVSDTVADVEGFEDLTTETVEAKAPGLSIDYIGEHVLPKLDLVEAFCKAVRVRAQEAAEAGENVFGHKLVEGRKGNRAWGDKTEAEGVLKSMRLKKEEMYSYSLASPAQVEKVLKKSPRRWARIEPLITQAEGKPTLVPETDPRPAVGGALEGFEDLETSTDDLL